MSMQTTQQTPTDVLAALRQGDEQALERLVRDRFASLNAEAVAELRDDPTGAPKVVERAFIRVWEARDQLDTPEKLEEFLHASVHEAAVRERSRRAARQRFENHHHVHSNGQSHGPTSETPEEAWQHVAAAVHAAVPDAAQLAATQHARHDLARHETASHMVGAVKPKRSATPFVIAGVVAVAVFGGLYWVNRTSEDVAITRALASNDVRVINTRPAQAGAVNLNDGSTATLAPDARITVPPNFGETVRAVRLDGAAVFAVKEAGERPLTVRAGNVGITATSGIFGVRADAGSPFITVRVTSGQATVAAGPATRTVSAGRAVQIDAQGAMREPDAAALEQATSWMDGQFAVRNQPLGAVLPQLVRWYGLELKVPDAALLNRPVSMRVPLDSSRVALAALEQSASVKFGWEGRDMVLRDARAAATR